MTNKRKTRRKIRRFRGNQSSDNPTPAKVAKLGENSAQVDEVSQPQDDVIRTPEPPDVCIRSRKIKTASPGLEGAHQEDYFMLINIDI